MCWCLSTPADMARPCYCGFLSGGDGGGGCFCGYGGGGRVCGYGDSGCFCGNVGGGCVCGDGAGACFRGDRDGGSWPLHKHVIYAISRHN